MRTFNEETHTYQNDGITYTGVNNFLVAVGLKKDITGVVPMEVLKKAWAKGIIIHKIAELTCLGTIDGSTIDERLINQYAQIKAFLKEFDVKVLDVEVKLWDDENYLAGTCDLIAETNIGTAIIDWDSGKSNKYYQMLCYKMICEKQENIEASKLISVHLSDKGKYKKRIFEPNPRDERLIRSKLDSYNFDNGRW